ncbi:hypothetical protein GKO47_13640 [SAR202 cluster bacterium JH639]|nr:hypothetical protein [SAR202 cluster bacterium JH639]
MFDVKSVVRVLLVGLVAAVIVGCDSKDDDPLSDLYGTWDSDVVTFSGVGQFPGSSTHEWNEDGTYRWEIDFTSEDSGCRVQLHWVGKFSGDESTLSFTPEGGEVEVSLCNDEASRQPVRSYPDEEVAASASTTNWGLAGDTLTLTPDDGTDRVYKRR